VKDAADDDPVNLLISNNWKSLRLTEATIDPSDDARFTFHAVIDGNAYQIDGCVDWYDAQEPFIIRFNSKADPQYPNFVQPID
jgi:hypothetical protein